MAYHEITSLAASAGLVLLAAPLPAAAKPSILEPPIGIQALLLNCVLYDPTCMKAPIPGLQPPEPVAVALPQGRRGSGDAPIDPDTTGSISSR